MLVVLCGEGPTDLGSCNNGLGTCQDTAFQIGPLCVIIDQILSPVLQYSLLDVPGSYRYFSRGYISAWSKANQPRMRPSRGLCSPPEVGIYRASAYALAEITKDIERAEGRTALAILFRDIDGTNSSGANVWGVKRAAILAGYQTADFASRGIAMLPMPKSEVWLLCAAKNSPYQNCLALESLSGNDRGLDSAKDALKEARRGLDSADALREWLVEIPFDHVRASQMPSFRNFKVDLLLAVRSVIPEGNR